MSILLLRVISSKLAESTGIWHAKTTEQRSLLDKVQIDLDMKEVQSIPWKYYLFDMALAKITAAGLPVTTVVYENCASTGIQFRNCFCQVFEFLGVSCDKMKVSASPEFHKSNRKTQRERISNYNDVARWLHSAGLGYLLEDLGKMDIMK